MQDLRAVDEAGEVASDFSVHALAIACGHLIDSGLWSLTSLVALSRVHRDIHAVCERKLARLRRLHARMLPLFCRALWRKYTRADDVVATNVPADVTTDTRPRFADLSAVTAASWTRVELSCVIVELPDSYTDIADTFLCISQGSNGAYGHTYKPICSRIAVIRIEPAVIVHVGNGIEDCHIAVHAYTYADTPADIPRDGWRVRGLGIERDYRSRAFVNTVDGCRITLGVRTIPTMPFGHDELSAAIHMRHIHLWMRAVDINTWGPLRCHERALYRIYHARNRHAIALASGAANTRELRDRANALSNAPRFVDQHMVVDPIESRMCRECITATTERRRDCVACKKLCQCLRTLCDPCRRARDMRMRGCVACPRASADTHPSVNPASIRTLQLRYQPW